MSKSDGINISVAPDGFSKPKTPPPAAPRTAHSILQAASKHMQDRATTYDKPAGERSMGATVEAFRAITGHRLTEEQGWLFMALLKAVRSQQGEFRADSYEDGAAYFALAGEAAHSNRKPKFQERPELTYGEHLEALAKRQAAAKLEMSAHNSSQYTGPGGVMVRCPGCNPEECPCVGA